MEMVLEILKTATRNIDILTEKFILIKYVTQRPEVSKSIQAYRTTTYFTFFRIMGQYSVYFDKCKGVLYLREYMRALATPRPLSYI